MLLLQIENYLLRNHETRKYLQEQAYRLQQGIVSSTTQQVGGARTSAAPGGRRAGRQVRAGSSLSPHLWSAVGAVPLRGSGGVLWTDAQEAGVHHAGRKIRA